MAKMLVGESCGMIQMVLFNTVNLKSIIENLISKLATLKKVSCFFIVIQNYNLFSQ